MLIIKCKIIIENKTPLFFAPSSFYKFMNKQVQYVKSIKKIFNSFNSTLIIARYSRKLAKRRRSCLPPISATLLVVILSTTENTVLKQVSISHRMELFSIFLHSIYCHDVHNQ